VHTRASDDESRTYHLPKARTPWQNVGLTPYTLSPVTQRNGKPAAAAPATIPNANSGLVLKITPAGTPASWRLERSSAHSSGRNSRRSIRVWPFAAWWPTNTPTWQLSVRPRVPEYCFLTPTDLVPFFGNPVSSTTTTASASPHSSPT